MAVRLVVLWLAAVAAVPRAAPRIGGRLTSSDRSLYIRSIPAVSGFSSNVYEVLMQPYAFDIRPLTAVVELRGEDAEEGAAASGVLVFMQPHPPVGPVLVTGNLTGLSPGLHGLHVHELGDLREGCGAVGMHFNPYQMRHGGPNDPVRHVGDLGNVMAGEDGAVKVELLDPVISLAGPRGVVGRAVVLRAGQDDLGRGATTHSLTSGGESAAVACGVVGYSLPEGWRAVGPPEPSVDIRV